MVPSQRADIPRSQTVQYMAKHIRPVFHGHHKCYRTDIDRDDELKGAVASNSQGGTGVADFFMVWEVPDQREPTIEWLKVAQI